MFISILKVHNKKRFLD